MATYHPQPHRHRHTDQDLDHPSISTSSTAHNTLSNTITDQQQEWIVFDKKPSLIQDSDSDDEQEADDQWQQVHNSTPASPSIASIGSSSRRESGSVVSALPSPGLVSDGSSVAAKSIMPSHDGAGNFFDDSALLSDSDLDEYTSGGLSAASGTSVASGAKSPRKRRKQRPPMPGAPKAKRSSSMSDSGILSSGDERGRSAAIGPGAQSFLQYLERKQLQSPPFSSSRKRRTPTRLQLKNGSPIAPSKQQSPVKPSSSTQVVVPSSPTHRILSTIKSLFLIDDDTLQLYFSDQFQHGTWGQEHEHYIHGLPEFLNFTAKELGEMGDRHPILQLSGITSASNYVTPPASRETTPGPETHQPSHRAKYTSEAVKQPRFTPPTHSTMSVGFNPTVPRSKMRSQPTSDSYILSPTSPFSSNDTADAMVDLPATPGSYLQAVWSIVRRKVLSIIAEEEEEDLEDP